MGLTRCRVAAHAGNLGGKARSQIPPAHHAQDSAGHPVATVKLSPLWMREPPGALPFLQDELSHPGSHSALTLLPRWKKHHLVSRQDHQKPPKDNPGRWHRSANHLFAVLTPLQGAGVSWRRKEPSVLAPRLEAWGRSTLPLGPLPATAWHQPEVAISTHPMPSP